MNRSLKILQTQFQNNTLPEFIRLVFKALFSIQRIRIFAKDLNTKEHNKVECEFIDRINKGDLQRLKRILSKVDNPIWEFRCHEYDGVQDFFWFLDKDETIAHITWIYYRGDPNRSTLLGENEVEVKYGITHPDYRGKRLLPAVLLSIQNYLVENGYNTMYASILEDNQASINATTRAGFQPVTRITAIKLFGFQLTKPYQTRQRRRERIAN